MLRVVGQQKCCVRLHRAKEHLRSKQYQAPRLSLDFHGNCLDIYLELLKVHRFKVISVPIMSHIVSYRNQNQNIDQRLIEVATCDDEFFLFFATLDKVLKNTKTGLPPTFEKLSLNTTLLYN